jgi:multisubunit Na+/H+ antiporter MnhG subunit
MFCQSCGLTVAEDWKFCTGCGSRQPGMPPLDPEGHGEPAAKVPDAPTPQALARSSPIQATNTGIRYQLGSGNDFFGVWDRFGGEQPIVWFPRSDEGWSSAWQAFSRMENEAARPTYHPVPPNPAPLERAPSAAERPWRRWLVAGGGAAVAVSPYLSWMRVALIGDLRLPDLLALAGQPSELVTFALLFGLIAIVASFSGREQYLKTAGTVLGAVSGVVAIYAFVALTNAVNQSSGFASLGLGPILAVAGAVSMFIGGILR